MDNNCNNQYCYWEFNGMCVHESEEGHKNATPNELDCPSALRADFETQLHLCHSRIMMMIIGSNFECLRKTERKLIELKQLKYGLDVITSEELVSAFEWAEKKWDFLEVFKKDGRWMVEASCTSSISDGVVQSKHDYTSDFDLINEYRKDRLDE